MPLPEAVLRLLAPLPVGAALGYLLARWHYSCRRLGRTWERSATRIERVAYRGREQAFRVCRRCDRREPDDVPLAPLGIDEIPPAVTEVRARKPKLTPVPSDRIEASPRATYYWARVRRRLRREQQGPVKIALREDSP